MTKSVGSQLITDRGVSVLTILDFNATTTVGLNMNENEGHTMTSNVVTDTIGIVGLSMAMSVPYSECKCGPD